MSATRLPHDLIRASQVGAWQRLILWILAISGAPPGIAPMASRADRRIAVLFLRLPDLNSGPALIVCPVPTDSDC